jgi:threonine/homoserine/homoserine lactone efflux protein
VSFPATIVPGPDTAVVLKNSLTTGRRAAVLTAAGCGAGQLM